MGIVTLRKARFFILCEDQVSGNFVRSFLVKSKVNRRRITLKVSPSGKGSGEQFVRKDFPKVLKEYVRRKGQQENVGLIAIIDADKNEASKRINDFQEACSKAKVPFRKDDENVAILVPKRNIETWLTYLRGEEVDEDRDKPYPKLSQNCKDEIKHLKEMCDNGKLERNPPPSLKEACNEYKNRIRF